MTNPTEATFSSDALRALVREVAPAPGDVDAALSWAANEIERLSTLVEEQTALKHAAAEREERLHDALCCYDCSSGECEHLSGELCNSYVERGCDCKKGRVPA